MNKKQIKKNKKSKVHKDLEGFELKVDAFGEIKSNLEIDKLNKFLNKNIDDKKLKDREDIEDLKREDPEPDWLFAIFWA